MRSAHRGEARRERIKTANTVAARMKHVVEKLIAEQQTAFVEQQPKLTVFMYKNQQLEVFCAFLFFWFFSMGNYYYYYYDDEFIAAIPSST